MYASDKLSRGVAYILYVTNRQATSVIQLLVELWASSTGGFVCNHFSVSSI